MNFLKKHNSIALQKSSPLSQNAEREYESFLDKYRWSTYLLALCIIVEFIFFILFRKVNLDEGWYLWASKLVYDGQQLYQDFAYTQTPLLPFVYGIFQQIFGQGLYQGRILSALFGASSGAIGAWIVCRHVQRLWPNRNGVANGAAFFSVALFLTSFYTICYFVYTATYSLAAFLLVCAVGVIYLFPPQNNKRQTSEPRALFEEMARYILATVFISCAIATRMSVVGALPALGLYLIATNRPQSRLGALRAIATIGITGIIAAAILLGPFWLRSGELMLYDIFGFHTDRIPSITRQWYRQLTTLRRSAWIYAVPFALMLLSMLAGIAERGSRQGKLAHQCPTDWRAWASRNGFELALVGMILGPLTLHLVPRTTDVYYNTLQFPLLCILASLLLARGVVYVAEKWPKQQWLYAKGLPTVIIASLLLNGTIHLAAVHRFDLVSLDKRTFLPINQVEIVKEAADFLRNIDKETNQLLTLNTHLALETEMRVPHGYEMSIFSYRPDWTTEEAERYHVVNNEMFIADLAAGADAVAITDFDAERFYGKRQQIFDTLTQKYRHAKTVANFDPQHKNLNIYLPPQFGEPLPQYQLLAEFYDGVRLLGYDLAQSHYRAGETVDIALYWQALAPVNQPYTVFVQVINPVGELVVGWDNPPCQRTCPTQSWQQDEILRDEYRIDLPNELEPGIYLVQIGLYQSGTAAPLQLQTLSPPAGPQRSDKNLIGTFIDGRLQLTQINIR